MTDADLEGFRKDAYFSRSWALLTRDRGWIKPVLALAAAALVPIVGLLIVLGYVVEWARLTAWGVTSSPKQRRVQVGACIASGWRAFVVLLVWSLGNALIAAALAAVPLFGAVLAFAWFIFSLFVGLMAMVAVMRATVYQRIRAGLRLSTVWQMAKSDVSGLMRVFGMQIAAAAILWVAEALLSVIAFAAAVPSILYHVDYLARHEEIMSYTSRQVALALQMIADALAAAVPLLIVMILVAAIGLVLATLLGYTAVALWMRQFNVPAWGREEDPLPTSRPSPQQVPESPADTEGNGVS